MVEDQDDTKLISHTLKRPRTIIAPKEQNEMDNYYLQQRIRTDANPPTQLPPRILYN